MTLFPSVAPERAPYLAQQIERHDEADVRQAMREYVDSADDKFLEITRLLAIAFRIGRQRRDKESFKNNQYSKQLRIGGEVQLQKQWAEVDAWVADTSDDDLAALKADVMAEHDAAFRSVLLKRDPRTSRTLKGLIYERVHGKRVAV